MIKTTVMPGDSRAQRDVFGETLLQLIEEDPRVVVLDGDLANSTKTDIVARARPDRFFMMGIGEQNMVGVAAGMATLGLIPWCVSFACFIVSRGLDQIRVVVAQPNLNVKLAGAYAGLLTGRTGKTHQDIWDLAVMRAVPHMTVLAPGDAAECAAAIRAATALVGPVYLRVTRDAGPTLFHEPREFVVGEAVRLREGTDVLLVSTGVQSARTLQAATFLADSGINAGLMHVPTVKPLDAEAIVAAARQTELVVTVEEHSTFGGLGSAVTELLSERHPTRIHRIGIQDRFGESASNDELLEKHSLSASRVAQTVRELVHTSHGTSNAPK